MSVLGAIRARDGEDGWPPEPIPSPFARKGRADATRPNAGATHLEAGMTVIAHLAQASLASVNGGDDDGQRPARTRRRRRGKAEKLRRGLASWLAKPFRLLMIAAGGILGVALTERAFFIFGLPPTETRVVVVGVELLFVYAGHAVGSRLKSGRRVTTAGRRVNLFVGLSLLASVLTVAIVRVIVLTQDLDGRPLDVDPYLAGAMFCSLGLLLMAVAIDAGLLPARPDDVEREARNRRATRHLDLAEIGRLRLRREGLLQQWEACLHAYRQAYLGAAGPELLAEVELVKPPPISGPIDPWEDEIDEDDTGEPGWEG